MNIVASARKKGVAFADDNPLAHILAESLDSAEGIELLNALKAISSDLSGAYQNEDDELIVDLLRSLTAPINKFFETTMVMAEDEQGRYARLSLMNAACQQLLVAGDFSKIVVEG